MLKLKKNMEWKKSIVTNVRGGSLCCFLCNNNVPRDTRRLKLQWTTDTEVINIVVPQSECVNVSSVVELLLLSSFPPEQQYF